MTAIQGAATPPVSTMDPAIADQLTSLNLVGAQRCTQLNGVLGRNLAANAGSVLTLGVQQVNMAALKNQTDIDPMEAAAAADVRASQDPSYFAGANVASRVPTIGQPVATTTTTPAT